MNHQLPSEKEIKNMFKLFKPLFWLNDPVFYGAENIPDEGPVLFVGNHTLLGVWDASIMWFKLFNEKKIFTYSLADRAHFHIPVWRELGSKFGMIEYLNITAFEATTSAHDDWLHRGPFLFEMDFPHIHALCCAQASPEKAEGD